MFVRHKESDDIVEMMHDYLMKSQAEASRLTKLQFLGLRYFLNSRLCELLKRISVLESEVALSGKQQGDDYIYHVLLYIL